MEYTNNNIFFARFFNPHTTTGTQKTGFFENFDFSDYSEELSILSDLIAKNIDLYLYNEYSQRYVVSTWARYMKWDKANKRYNIDPDFYDAFAAALSGHILTAQNFFDITQLELGDITEIIEKTKIYGARSKTHTRGNDTTTVGAREDSERVNIGAQNVRTTENTGAQNTRTTNSYGLTHSESETENKKYPFDAQAYINDTKTHTDNDSDAHEDNITLSTGAREDQTTTASGAREDVTTTNTGSQLTTKTYGNEATTDSAVTDTETIEETKGLDRAELVRIKTELARLNVYQLIGDAVAATMCRSDFGIDYNGAAYPMGGGD